MWCHMWHITSINFIDATFQQIVSSISNFFTTSHNRVDECADKNLIDPSITVIAYWFSSESAGGSPSPRCKNYCEQILHGEKHKKICINAHR